MMTFVLSVLFAMLLVIAQSSWKLATNAEKSPFQGEFNLAKVIGFAFTPLVLLGIMIYATTTVLYWFMLSRYPYSHIQAVAIPMALLFSVLVATIFFGERLSPVHYMGIGLIIAGVLTFMFGK